MLHGCRRCFWFKVAAGQKRPPSPMPGVFTRMDACQRAFFHERSTRDIHPSLPAGKLNCHGLKVLSRPIELPGHQARVRFRGEMDALGELDGGGFVAVDFKTASWKESQVPYALQLHAYAWGLENAEWPNVTHAPVPLMGLLFFDPKELVGDPKEALSFRLTTTWEPVERDDEWFREFLSQACTLLESPIPPVANPSCGFCSWRGYQT